jgi:hypothetical protein
MCRNNIYNIYYCILCILLEFHKKKKMSNNQNNNNPSIETIWQWLTEAEDKMEEAISANHVLHGQVQKLERKDLVKEICKF